MSKIKKISKKVVRSTKLDELSTKVDCKSNMR